MKQKNYLVSNATVRQTYDKIAERECFLRAILSISNWRYCIMVHLKLIKNEIEAEKQAPVEALDHFRQI